MRQDAAVINSKAAVVVPLLSLSLSLFRPVARFLPRPRDRVSPLARARSRAPLMNVLTPRANETPLLPAARR